MAVPRRGSAVRGRLILGLTASRAVKIEAGEEVPEKIWTRWRVVVYFEGKRIKTFAYWDVLGLLDIDG